MRRALAPLLASLFAPLLVTVSAHAATSLVTSPGAGQPALAVKVDLAKGQLRFKSCGGATGCDATSGTSVPITLAAAMLPAEGEVVIEDVALGDGKRAVHVRVPAKGSEDSPRHLAWEAILAPGASEPLFAAMTGFFQGDDDERRGTVVQVLPREGDSKYVVVGDAREDLRICGQRATALSPRLLDAKTMTLRGATLQRLSREQRDGAKRVVAIAKDAPAKPLAKLLLATGSSVPDVTGGALTDGDPKTTWSEARPGDGRGEFVVMRAPREVPIVRLRVVVAPPLSDVKADVKAEAKKGAAPRSLYFVTDAATFAVTLPEDAWMHPGRAYEVPLGEGVRTSCLSMVLDDAYSDAAHPEVTVAEVSAESEFDGAEGTLDKVAEALTGGGARAEAAAAILKRAGEASLGAVTAAFDKLDAHGRALAADIAASQPSCEKSAPLLVRAMIDKDAEVARKGQSKLERCGKAANGAFAKSITDDAASRAKLAPMFARIAPDAALEPLSRVMGEGPDETRLAVRGALAYAARSATPERLASLFSDRAQSEGARTDRLRALSARLPEIEKEASAAVGELLAAGAPMRTRYLLVEPLASLARAGHEPSIARLSEMASRDADWPVRMRAVEASKGIAKLKPTLVRAVSDAEPRVRMSAVVALEEGERDAASVGAVSARLSSDRWTFVRSEAASYLSRAPASPETDKALTSALKDGSPRVRASAAQALGDRHVLSTAEALGMMAEDKDEDVAARTAAIHALGAMCHMGSTERLTRILQSAASPTASEAEAATAAEALRALGRLGPGDLADRLKPLFVKDIPPSVQRAARATLEQQKERGPCR